MAKEDRIKAWTPTMRDRAQSWAQERLEAAGMSRYKARQLAEELCSYIEQMRKASSS